MEVSWSSVLPTSSTKGLPGKPPQAAGVYLLVVAQDGGGWRPFYAGQASDLSVRLSHHWSASEDNECVKFIVGKFRCGYYYAKLFSAADRDKAERALIQHYDLTSSAKGKSNGQEYYRYCNTELPDAPDVTLNWPM